MATDKLPIFKSDNEPMVMMQTKWASVINPVLGIPLNQGLLLQDVSLVSGSNTINHRLGRKLVGWIVTRLRSSATIYDTQDTNQRPSLTLELVASAPVVADIFVF